MDQKTIHIINGLLTRDPRINLNDSQIAITEDNGQTVLSGTVSTVAVKKLAVRHASQVTGQGHIIDELRVSTPNPMGELELAEQVRRSFIDEKNIEETQISIETDPLGTITLRGHVRSLVQKRLSEVLCWWVRGVTDVHNEINVLPPEQDNDDELKDNLMVIMEKDVLVNPKKFSLDVHDGTVTLQGHVDSEMEKDAAEMDCWYTPGVVEVSNQLSLS